MKGNGFNVLEKAILSSQPPPGGPPPRPPTGADPVPPDEQADGAAAQKDLYDVIVEIELPPSSGESDQPTA